MTIKLLIGKNLEKLTKTLKILPISNWKKKEFNEYYCAPHLAYSEMDSETKYVNYTTFLDSFKINLSREKHWEQDSYTRYYLRIYTREEADQKKYLDAKRGCDCLEDTIK
ncbi:MAG: hypothetical protein PF542_02335 [Nanoarchaeota archaeon]|jgi:hypothetical protein|nr:hypothetical protein [Nanoarchaeota archaeon]